MEINGILSLRLLMLIMLACYATSTKAESDDVSCLRSIKESLEDPEGFAFSTWEFHGISDAFICTFITVKCWPDKINVVMSIYLRDMGLRGPFPIGISYCTNLQNLDLSNNYISGRIPSNIGYNLTMMVYFIVSNNSLSGPIPPSVVNWRSIRSLKLEDNHLTGQIPPGLRALDTIKFFNVSNNRLSGPVPIFSTSFSAGSYANNTGLCGGPLKACKDDEHDVFLSGSAVGCPLFTILSMVFLFYFL